MASADRGCRGLAGGMAVVAFLCAGMAEAACDTQRRIYSRYSYVYTPGIQNGYLDSSITGAFRGAFWALDNGHPTPGAGIDSGKLPVVDGYFDGWLTIYPRVGMYGYPPLIDTAWDASPLIDGCIDTTGSDPEQPDLQQCVVAMFADQHDGAGYFAIVSAPADLAGDYDLTVPGDLPILLAGIPRPFSDFDPYIDDPINVLELGPPPLGGAGQYVDLDCPDVVDGYRVYRNVVPRGSAPPVDRLRDDGPGGWEVAAGGQRPDRRPLPLDQGAVLTFGCTERSDVYLAYSIVFDSGYETPYLSANHLTFAIDCCTDADADGLCAEPGEGRDHDCDDGNAGCGTDCTDGDGDLSCAPNDCDDGNPAVRAGVAEVCDGVDNNCDGRQDEQPAPLGAVTATGAVGGARFGSAVTSLGDLDMDGYEDFAVGADTDRAAGIDEAGSVTLFSGRTRTPITRILHPDPQPGDRFGSAVARLPDVNFDGFDELIVGADGDDTEAGVDTGSVFVVSGSPADVFPLLYTLTEPAAVPGDRFGTVLTTLGDHDADGLIDFAVGNPDADGHRGRVRVFSGASGLLLRTLTLSGAVPGDRYGCAMARVEGLDGGSTDLAVGACGADSPAATGAGIVQIVSGGSWLTIDTLFDPLGQAGYLFGSAIAELADLDSDELPEILVGAAGGDGGAVLLSLATGVVLRRLVDPALGPGRGFGETAVALGDLDGDGVGDIAVGTATGAGSVSVFSGAGPGPPIVNLGPGSGMPAVGYGAALAAIGDLDDDGVGELLVGAPFADRETPLTGDARIVSGAVAVDQDADGTGDACDCAPLDATAQTLPQPLDGLQLSGTTPTTVTWMNPSSGPGHRYDVAGGQLSDLRRDGGPSAATCVASDAPDTAAVDDGPPPPPGDGFYYLARSRNACGSSGYGLNSAGAPRGLGEPCPDEP